MELKILRIYNHFNSIPDFIDQCIPKRGAGPYDSMFVHQVIDGLKRLDSVQQTNRAVTLPFELDGINVFHASCWLCKIFPGQTGLKVAFDGGGVSQGFDEAVKHGLAIDKSMPSYRAWTGLPEGRKFVKTWTIHQAKLSPRLALIHAPARSPRGFRSLYSERPHVSRPREAEKTPPRKG